MGGVLGMLRIGTAVTVVLFAACTGGVAVASPAPRTYANCAQLNAVYPHGVARAGGQDVVRGSGRPVTTFVVNTKVYALNTKSDRDGDGVACEKR